MQDIIDFSGYTSKNTENAINLLTENYNFLKNFYFGKSVGGTRLTALRLGNSRDVALFVASVHGNEYITTTLLLKFIYDLCESIAKGSSLCGIDFNVALKSNSIVFVPMLNPDGCDFVQGETSHLPECKVSKALEMCNYNTEIFKANLNGVDINHNFPACWEKLKCIEIEHGITEPTYGKFGGYSAVSEPETAGIINLCKILNPRTVLALHTQGEVIYYGFGKSNKAETQMAEIFSMLSGYSLAVPDYLSSLGGFKDWFADYFKKPAFTIECGLGKNPLPISDAPRIYNRIKELLAVASVM